MNKYSCTRINNNKKKILNNKNKDYKKIIF